MPMNEQSLRTGAVPQTAALPEAGGEGSSHFNSPPVLPDRRRAAWEETRALLEWELRHYMDSDRKAFIEGVRWGMKRSADLGVK